MLHWPTLGPQRVSTMAIKCCNTATGRRSMFTLPWRCTKIRFFFLEYTVIGLLRSFVLYRLNLQESRCVSSLCSFFFFSLAESRPLDYTGKDVSAIGKISLVMIDRDFAYKCKRICSEFRQKGRCQSDSKLQEKKNYQELFIALIMGAWWDWRLSYLIEAIIEACRLNNERPCMWRQWEAWSLYQCNTGTSLAGTKLKWKMWARNFKRFAEACSLTRSIHIQCRPRVWAIRTSVN